MGVGEGGPGARIDFGIWTGAQSAKKKWVGGGSADFFHFYQYLPNFAKFLQSIYKNKKRKGGALEAY